MTVNHRRTTQWELFFQYLTIPLGMVSGIVLVPLYLKYIPQDVYGAWLATGNVLAWLTITDPGLSGVLRQKVAEAYGKGEHSSIGEIVSSGLMITIVITAVLIGLGLVVSTYLTALLKLPSSVDVAVIEQAFSVSMLGTGCMIFYYSLDSISKGMQSTLAIGVIQVVVRIAYIGLMIILLLGGKGIMGLAYSQLFNGLALAIITFFFVIFRLKQNGIRLSWTVRRVPELARVLTFTFLARTVAVIGNNVELVGTTRMLGPDMAAVLALTRRVPESIRPLIDRPAYAFLPAITYLYGGGEIDRIRKILMRLFHVLFWLFGLFVTGFIVMNEHFIKLWIGSQFFAGTLINTLICTGILLSVVIATLNGLCFAMGDIKGTSIVGLIQGVLAIVLLYFGGKYFGMTGLVAAPILAMLAVSIWYLPFSLNRRLRLKPLEIWSIINEALRVLVVSALVYFLVSAYQPNSWVEFGFEVIVLIIAYGMVLLIVSDGFKKECKNVRIKMMAFSK
ncbi:MAG: lipopolysaccharide biosynthesis protein [Candidatus Methylumidiphilus sp.]